MTPDGDQAQRGAAQSDADAAQEPPKLAPTLSEYEALLRENAALRSQVAQLQESSKRKHHVVKTTLGSKMSHHVVSHQGKIGRRHMRGTASSMASAEILAGLFTPRETVPEKLLSQLDDPAANVAYFRGKQFAIDLMALCEQAQALLEKESRCLYVQSPCHVFGDIHGNLEDLHFFGENVWPKGIKLTPGRLLFLGDYVDRGMQSLECVAYLLSMKVLAPAKVFLLRGNHELRDVNSWEDYYGEGSFLWQCKDRFGIERGPIVWEAVNQLFDRLPLAAVIDNDIFCIHGGIPRPRPGLGQIESILRVPTAASVSPPYPCEDPDLTRVAYECLWSDPAKTSDEAYMDARGYGANPRGSTAQCFGRAAVEEFLTRHDMSYIIRAHEKTAEGITVSKGGRVLTVFSTSKDHHLGEGAMSACLLVDDARIEVITKDPSYVGRPERARRARAAAMAAAVSGGGAAGAAAAALAVNAATAAALSAPAASSRGPFSFSDDHLFGDGAQTVQEEIIDLDIDMEAVESMHDADRLNSSSSGSSAAAQHSSSDASSATAAASGSGLTLKRPSALRLVEPQLGFNTSSKSDVGSAQEGPGAVPSLVSPSSTLDRRESMDVGLFRQLRAQAPPVKLQPSAAQSRAYQDSEKPLQRDRAASEGSSSTSSGDLHADDDLPVDDSTDAAAAPSTATAAATGEAGADAGSSSGPAVHSSDDDNSSSGSGSGSGSSNALSASDNDEMDTTADAATSNSSNKQQQQQQQQQQRRRSSNSAAGNGSNWVGDSVSAVSTALMAAVLGGKDSKQGSSSSSSHTGGGRNSRSRGSGGSSRSNSNDSSSGSGKGTPARRLRGRLRDRDSTRQAPVVAPPAS